MVCTSFGLIFQVRSIISSTKCDAEPSRVCEFSGSSSEEACQEYLAACRWPDGFKCPRCGNQRAYVMTRLWQCAGCRHQVSLTSGTILHNTRVSLVLWFWAAYLMTTDKRGISALLLQRQLELRRYETAWMMLHKLRRAMVNVAREPLRGEVEIDEAWIGGPQAGLRGSRQLKGVEPLLSWWPLRNAARHRRLYPDPFAF